MNTVEEIWAAALGELEVVLSKPSFATWFRGVSLADIEGEEARINLPSIFYRSWFEKRFHPDVVKTLSKLTSGKVKKVSYQIGAVNASAVLNSGPVQSQPLTEVEEEKAPPNPVGLNLHPGYSFDGFVVGQGNRLAYAASRSVAQNPGKSHNPLVIYGGVGLGKTHLMHAIGNEIRQKSPRSRLIYTSCEAFANEFVHSIQSKKTDLFKNRYRNIDVFLVDDIQFLSRKEGTQEEFFHTFNALHQGRKQIVMTSDRLPTAIPDLEARLSSRFSMGMVADVAPPNLETRMAILQKKAQLAGWEIEKEVLEYIAENFSGNIRELEGALNRVAAESELQNVSLSLSLARDALKNLLYTKRKGGKDMAGRLINTIVDYYGITSAELTGKNRRRELVHPRHLAMYLLHNELNLSYPIIGRLLGGKDHTTVIHGATSIEKNLSRDNGLMEELSAIRSRLYKDS